MRQHSFVSLSPCLSVYKKKEDSEGWKDKPLLEQQFVNLT